MGNLTSHANADSNVEVNSSDSYRYCDNRAFFGSHFLMGGERFEINDRQAFLFGDGTDLNFLGSRPIQWDRVHASSSEPARAIDALINIRRDTVKLVRITSPIECSTSESGSSPATSTSVNIDTNSTNTNKKSSLNFTRAKPIATRLQRSLSTASQSTNNSSCRRHDRSRATSADSAINSAMVSTVVLPDVANKTTYRYRLQFTFDCDCPCSITVYHLARHMMQGNDVRYVSGVSSKCYYFPMGAAQVFCPDDYVFDVAQFDTNQLKYNPQTGVVPLVIHCVAHCEDENLSESQATLAVVDRSADDRVGYVVKPLKQKLFVNGVAYLMQEIYGIENKHTPVPPPSPHDAQQQQTQDTNVSYEESGGGSECIICMSELRDTLILPCRHLCVCQQCAENLRYKASNCPICRSPFRALLQLKTLRRLNGKSSIVGGISATLTPSSSISSTSTGAASALTSASMMSNGIRFEAVPLLEALNGPSMSASPPYTQSCATIPCAATMRQQQLATAKSEPDMQRMRENSVRQQQLLRQQPQATTGATTTTASRKKQAKASSPIQEVLMPQALHSLTLNASPVTERSYQMVNFATTSSAERRKDYPNKNEGLAQTSSARSSKVLDKVVESASAEASTESISPRTVTVSEVSTPGGAGSLKLLIDPAATTTSAGENENGDSPVV